MKGPAPDFEQLETLFQQGDHVYDEVNEVRISEFVGVFGGVNVSSKIEVMYLCMLWDIHVHVMSVQIGSLGNVTNLLKVLNMEQDTVLPPIQKV